MQDTRLEESYSSAETQSVYFTTSRLVYYMYQKYLTSRNCVQKNSLKQQHKKCKNERIRNVMSTYQRIK